MAQKTAPNPSLYSSATIKMSNGDKPIVIPVSDSQQKLTPATSSTSSSQISYPISG